MATAATVTIPNTFTSGTPAVAAQVNGNFTAVKTAVDDNDNRVSTNAASIATNGTNIGINSANVTDIDSRVTTNAASIATNGINIGINSAGVNALNTNLSNHVSAVTSDIWIGINARSFVSSVTNVNQSNECVVNNVNDVFGIRFLNIGTTTSNCGLIAGISLPHLSVIKEVKCSQRPSATGAGIVLGSYPTSGTIAFVNHIGIAAPTTANSHVVTSASSGIFTPIVNNENRTYFLDVNIVSPDFSGPGAGANWGFYGCSIRVTPAAS